MYLIQELRRWLSSPGSSCELEWRYKPVPGSCFNVRSALAQQG